MHRSGRWELACVFLSLPGSEVRARGEDRIVGSECRVWGSEAASPHQLSCVSAGPSGASSWEESWQAGRFLSQGTGAIFKQLQIPVLLRDSLNKGRDRFRGMRGE